MNIDTVNIDGTTYMEVDKINVSDATFAYLVNEKDKDDFCIRRIVAKDGKVFYEGLIDDKQFDLALMYFAKKHQNIISDNKKD